MDIKVFINFILDEVGQLKEEIWIIESYIVFINFVLGEVK